MLSVPVSFRRFAAAVLALGMAAGLAGCSSFKNDDDDEIVYSTDPADKLYNQGLYYLENKDFKQADKKFKEVDLQHPYTEWARKANVMAVYSKYKQGEYDEAIAEGKRYVTLNPGSKDADYVQFLVGMSYYNQIQDVSRDQKRTQDAMNE